MAKRLKISPGKCRQIKVSVELIRIKNEINRARRKMNKKPLSFNNISKIIAIKIQKGDRILYDEFVKL